MSRTEKASILIIYTGGTIGMIQNTETGALESFNFDHLLKHVPEVKQLNIDIDAMNKKILEEMNEAGYNLGADSNAVRGSDKKRSLAFRDENGKEVL